MYFITKTICVIFIIEVKKMENKKSKKGLLIVLIILILLVCLSIPTKTALKGTRAKNNKAAILRFLPFICPIRTAQHNAIKII